MLKLYNTLTRKNEIFKPLSDKNVHIYTCGPTVYNYAHIGNMRSYVFNDLLKRYLKFRGYKVKHVMNITDVDDKIIRDSQKKGQNLKDFTENYAKAFFEDIKKLNIELPDVISKATDHIQDMVKFVEKLLENGLAYEKNGSIYFKISKFQNYGQLAQLQKQELKQNAQGRLNIRDEYEKESIGDFALWKAWSVEDGPVSYESPFGKGRPGWHIECSAMSMKYLGETFDIHTGGVDLVFPHHTNEIAQSEGATGKKFVNFWLHNEHLIVDGKKMSKSAGNFYTLRDLEEKGLNLLLFRYILLKTHYRQILDFNFGLFNEAKSVAEKFVNFFISLDLAKKRLLDHSYDLVRYSDKSNEIEGLIKKSMEKFNKAMDDDLNVSVGLSVVFEFMEEVNKEMDNIKTETLQNVKEMVLLIDTVFGFIKPLYNNYLDKLSRISSDTKIIKMVQERETARRNKDFKKADNIRQELANLGIEIKDLKSGPVLELIEKI